MLAINLGRLLRIVGQEILYETSWCSKYSIVVNSRELLLHLPSEKHVFKRYKWEEEENRDGKHTEQSLKVGQKFTLYPQKVRKGTK